MRVENYSFGSIAIDGKTYSKDVLLLPPRILCPWWRREGHRLDTADLDEVMAYAPEVLVIGTGAHGLMKVPDETRAGLAASGVEVEVLATEQACRVFGVLIAEGKRAAAAFHLTC